MQKFDVVVIGGGILGVFHAYHAIQKGLSVALLEKNSRPQGSSVQNFGQVVPSGMSRRWQRLGRESLEIYKSIQAKYDITARQNGSIYLASNADEMTLLEELAQINRDEAYPSVLMTAAECAARYPGLKSDYCIGGLFFPEEITLEPRAAIHRILSYLTLQQGLQYHPNALIHTIENTGTECIVQAGDGRKWHADRVLICSGYEFQLLFPEVYAKSDLQSVKLQMLQLVPQPNFILPGSILTGLTIRRYESFHECPSYSAIKAREDSDSYVRRHGIHILFKQAIDGSIILGDSHEYADVEQADTLGFDVDYSVNEFMLSAARDIFDLPDWQVRQAWCGFYAQSKHNDIFHHRIDDRIEIITGIGGKGMTGSAGYAAHSPFFEAI